MSEQRRQPGMTATAFIGRVRAALGRSAGEGIAPAPEPGEDLVRRCGDDDDLDATFADAAERAGMVVHRCRRAAFDATLTGLVESLGARSATLSVGRSALGDAARSVLENSGCRLAGTESMDDQYDVDIGVTDVTAAIAETGSIVVAGDARRSRGAFLVPPVHIALVELEQVVPDLQDFWNTVASTPSADLPAGMVIVTGPSKTADIEGILITGVHGPRAVHIVFCSELDSQVVSE